MDTLNTATVHLTVLQDCYGYIYVQNQWYVVGIFIKCCSGRAYILERKSYFSRYLISGNTAMCNQPIILLSNMTTGTALERAEKAAPQ